MCVPLNLHHAFVMIQKILRAIPFEILRVGGGGLENFTDPRPHILFFFAYAPHVFYYFG